MSQLLRTVYQGMLRLHPADFRAEFGDEMLWIFDEECKCGRALAVMLDGIRSLTVQVVRKSAPVQYEAVGGIYVEIDSTIPAERIAQKWLVTLSCTLSLTMFMSMMVPGLAMPLGRLIYASVHRSSAPPVVEHIDTLRQHHPEYFR